MRIIKKTLDIHDFQKIKAMIFMTDGCTVCFLVASYMEISHRSRLQPGGGVPNIDPNKCLYCACPTAVAQ